MRVLFLAVSIFCGLSIMFEDDQINRKLDALASGVFLGLAKLESIKDKLNA